MQVLMLVTDYSLDRGELRMWNELTAALLEAGHQVDVVSMNWAGNPNQAPKVTEGPSGERLLIVPPLQLKKLPLLAQRAAKWLLTPFRTGREVARRMDARGYDVLVTAMPLVLHAPVLRQAFKKKEMVGVLLIHDFFPIHHAEINLVPKRLVPVLKRIEERLAAKFDVIYCNLPTNMDYLRKHYRLPKPNQILSWAPLWTRIHPPVPLARDEVRKRHGLPHSQPIAVFGGQLTEGRGIGDLLKVAQLGRELGSSLHFLFVGSGRLSGLVEAEARAAGSNISLISHLPREEYLTLLTACEVGMIATVPGVSSHSFPTKLLEYLRVGIPSVVAVEPGSPYAEMVTSNGVGLSVSFGDLPAYLAALEQAVSDRAFRDNVPDAAQRMLEDVLDVRHIVAKIETDVAMVQEQGARKRNSR